MEARRTAHRHTLHAVSAVALLFMLSPRPAAADANGVWSQIGTGQSPGVRSHAVAAYDRQGKRMLLFGGLGPNGPTDLKNDVWQLSLECPSDWQQITTNGTPPSPRLDAAGVYDPVHDQFVVFGGKDASGENGQTWVLSLGNNTWSMLDEATACHDNLKPCPREGHSAVFNDSDGKMWVFGGQTCDLQVADNWIEQLTSASNTWTGGGGTDQCEEYYLPDKDCLPEIRSAHSEIYDSRNHLVVIMGGIYEGDNPDCVSTSNVYEYYGHSCKGQQVAWTRLADLPGTSGRAGHRAVYDSLAARMIVFGGACSSDSTVALSLPTAGGVIQPAWSTLHPTGTPPPGSTAYHAAIFDPGNDRMVVFDNNGNTWQLCFSDSDIAPPATTTDLRITSIVVSQRKATLSWTQAGNNGMCGQAAMDSLRKRSGSPITDANWSTSTLVAGFPAAANEFTVSYTASGLSGSSTWYFATKTTDAAGNSSDVSNNDCVTFSSPPSICSDGGNIIAQLPPDDAAAVRVLAISAVRPNPTRNGAEISFTLAEGPPATLEVLDILGRRVEVLDLAGFNPGPNSVFIGARLAPGSYRVRIRQGDRFATRSAIVMR